MKAKLKQLAVVIGVLVALIGLVGPAEANNIRVTRIALQSQDTSAKTVKVAFDIAWDNAWRGAENWDAAWVFVKFRAPGSNNWEHAVLSTNNSDHTSAANGTNAAAPDGTGVFISRASGYTGSVSYAQTKLLWNYGSNGYNFAKGSLVEVSVQAIEMVYVPQGQFYLGSGGTDLGHFYQPDGTSQTTQPYLVTSETNAITVGVASGNLYYVGVGGTVGDGAGPIPAAFPKGYNAFYCMKYEISQGQYVDFLNKLTAAQTNARYSSASTGNRYTISVSNNTFTAAARDRACNFLSWGDGIAYADWAGLRPMSELEFEKACRGSAYPVTNEYAWGNATTLVTLDAVGCIGVDGSGTETPRPTNANCLVSGGLQGPTRVGIFATTNSTRASAGASYWGIMELSGNVWERTVSAGQGTVGRAFTGLHGDGKLTAAGEADAVALKWPLGTDANGAGGRGGFWGNSSDYARVSDRTLAAGVYPGRNNCYGWRGVRLAPSGVGP